MRYVHCIVEIGVNNIRGDLCGGGREVGKEGCLVVCASRRRE